VTRRSQGLERAHCFTVLPGGPRWHAAKPAVPQWGSTGDSNPRDRFWSSSLNADDSNNAWNVNFDNGNVNNDNIDNDKGVRCVRPGT
jgi:hypothetical protein